MVMSSIANGCLAIKHPFLILFTKETIKHFKKSHSNDMTATKRTEKKTAAAFVNRTNECERESTKTNIVQQLTKEA